jgi:hypothetical protein
LEHLLDDAEFERKVVDTFVRIRVPGNASTSETCYRLVLVTGTRQQSELYRAGKKLTNFVLEILNLQRKEYLTIDLVSNQDFSEVIYIRCLHIFFPQTLNPKDLAASWKCMYECIWSYGRQPNDVPTGFLEMEKSIKQKWFLLGSVKITTLIDKTVCRVVSWSNRWKHAVIR